MCIYWVMKLVKRRQEQDEPVHKIKFPILVPRQVMHFKQMRDNEWGHMPVYCIFTGFIQGRDFESMSF